MRPLLFAVLLGLMAPAAAGAAADTAPNQHCFASTQWRGWSAPGDGDALYLRVGMHDVYEVGLTPGTHLRRFGDQFLVNQIRGSTQICSPIDLDLTLNDPHGGIVRALVATSLRKLTPTEIEAIPPHDRPS